MPIWHCCLPAYTKESIHQSGTCNLQVVRAAERGGCVTETVTQTTLSFTHWLTSPVTKPSYTFWLSRVSNGNTGHASERKCVSISGSSMNRFRPTPMLNDCHIAANESLAMVKWLGLQVPHHLLCHLVASFITARASRQSAWLRMLLAAFSCCHTACTVKLLVTCYTRKFRLQLSPVCMQSGAVGAPTSTQGCMCHTWCS